LPELLIVFVQVIIVKANTGIIWTCRDAVNAGGD